MPTNINVLNYKSHNDTDNYLDILLNNRLLPLITLPTRVSHQSATLIDNISSTDVTTKYETGILLSSLSDHFPVYYIKYFPNKIQQPPSNLKFRKINSLTMLTFENLVKNISWDDILTEKEPQQAFQKFYEKIDSLTEIAFPEVTKKSFHKQKPNLPWFSNGLRISNLHKMKLASKKLKKPTNENINNYKKYLSIYNKLIRKAKIMHYQKQFELSKYNMKKTWDTVFELTSSAQLLISQRLC